MAKIVTKDQRIVTAGSNPTSVYSRWVGFCFPVAFAAPGELWDVTEVLAQTLWLLQVKLIITSTGDSPFVDCCWRIVTCTTVPANANQIATQLEPVVSVRWLNKPYAYYAGTDREFCFEMKRLYQGAGRRFAVWVQNNSTAINLWVVACFLVSEG